MLFKKNLISNKSLLFYLEARSKIKKLFK